MKMNYKISAVVIVLSTITLSCDKTKSGACERYTSLNEYICSYAEDKATCRDEEALSSSTYEGQLWYYTEDESCKDLGYKYKLSGSGNSFISEKDDATNPGDNGYFADNSSDDDGNNSGSDNCSDTYEGPNDGWEYNMVAFCQTAWIGRCVKGYSATQTEIVYTCNSYEQLKNLYDNPSVVPDCPYCE